jgi:hypothetical protein
LPYLEGSRRSFISRHRGVLLGYTLNVAGTLQINS